MSIDLFVIENLEVVVSNGGKINQFLSVSDFCFHVYSAQNNCETLLTFISNVFEDDKFKSNNAFFIICQNDDFLTADYNKEKLMSIVDEANSLDADLIFGGMMHFNNAVVASENLFWVDHCLTPSFTIIFKKFYHKLVSNTEIKLNSIQDLNFYTENKYAIFPFISQKENKGIDLYLTSSDKLRVLKKVHSFYSSKEDLLQTEYDSITIPTYIINLENRKDRLLSIAKEFENRPEFETHIIKACVHDIGALGLLESIRLIIKKALINDDDVILIVEDDHVFTDKYDRDLFIKNVFEAGYQGAEILSGGISGGFQYAVPITNNRYWINHFWGTQFIVVYRKFFETILTSKYENSDTADDLLSRLSLSKMVLYPFISIQKDFGYSDIVKINSSRSDLSKLFLAAERKLKILAKAYLKIKDID